MTDLVGQTVYWQSSFTTGTGAQATGPVLSLLTPPNGATDVPLNARVIEVMNSAVNPVSVNAAALTVSAAVPVAGSASLSGIGLVSRRRAWRRRRATTSNRRPDLAGNPVSRRLHRS